MFINWRMVYTKKTVPQPVVESKDSHIIKNIEENREIIVNQYKTKFF